MRATLKANRGLSRSIQSLKVTQASEGCRVRCARAHWVKPAGAMTSSRTLPISSLSRPSIGCSAAATSGSANAKASAATIRRVGNAAGMASASMTPEILAKVSGSRANQPVVSELGACGIMPETSTRPWVGRIP